MQHHAGRLTEAYDELGSRYVIPKYCISKPTNMAASEGDLDNDDDIQEPDSSTQLLQGQSSPSRSSSKLKAGFRPSANVKKPSSRNVSAASVNNGPPLIVKVRLSTQPKDIKVQLTTDSRVRDLKRKLVADHNVDDRKITMLYSGRVLSNRTLLKDLDIPKGFVIQAIVSDSQ